MNILFLSDVYFPRINGVSTSIHTLRGQLLAMGHSVHLVAPDYYSPSDDESWITRLPARTLPFDPEDRLIRYGRALKILAHNVRGPYDLAHIHTPFAAHFLGLRLAAQMGIPCVETYHTFFEDYLHHYLPFLPRIAARPLARALSRSQCNAVDAVIAPSQPMRDALHGYGVKAPVAVVPTGLEQHSFVAGDGAAFRKRYDLPATRPLLLFVGRVAHEKNIGFLLRMLAQLIQTHPDALLLIAGEGPAQESVRRESEALQLGEHIRFLGYLDRHTELNDCYAAADVFVFSSLTETQGLVLLEAMAQAVPVVAIAEMGTKSILREGQGALVSPADVTLFAGRVAELLADSALRQRLGQAAACYAQQWSALSMTEKMLQFYQQVMAASALPERALAQAALP